MNDSSENLKVGYALLAVLLLAFYVTMRLIEKMAHVAWKLIKICWKKRSTPAPDVEVVDA